MSVARYMTPPEVADRYGVDPAKVIGWIRKGALRAVNVGDGARRPRYRIAPADLAAFEASRTVTPPVPRVRRRRVDPNIVQFF